MHSLTKKVILASQSPRRKKLLGDMCIPFEVRIREIEEIYPHTLQAKDVSSYLAELKAKAFEEDIQEDEIIITSDTVVLHGNQVLGKPKDREDAFNMLSSMSNTTHVVSTAVCFFQKNKKDTISDRTEVLFHELSADEINFYLDNFKPFDKAGAYGIQDWMGLNKIKSLNGSYYNVMGFPTDIVYQYLKKYMTK